MKVRIVLLTALLALVVSCAKQVPKFTYDTNINSVVVVKNQLGGHGTGFYIGNGIVVTAKHVVPKEVSGMALTSEGYKFVTKTLEFTAEDFNKECFKLEVVYRSEDNDIAFLKIEDGHNLAPAILAERNPKIGDKIFMVSHPATYKWSYSEGYVVNIPVDFVGDKFAMMHDIARFYGSSGAGIFDEKGQIVGLMNALLPDSSIAIGHTVKTIKEDLGRYYRDK